MDDWHPVLSGEKHLVPLTVKTRQQCHIGITKISDICQNIICW